MPRDEGFDKELTHGWSGRFPESASCNSPLEMKLYEAHIDLALFVPSRLVCRGRSWIVTSFGRREAQFPSQRGRI